MSNTDKVRSAYTYLAQRCRSTLVILSTKAMQLKTVLGLSGPWHWVGTPSAREHEKHHGRQAGEQIIFRRSAAVQRLRSVRLVINYSDSLDSRVVGGVSVFFGFYFEKILTNNIGRLLARYWETNRLNLAFCFCFKISSTRWANQKPLKVRPEHGRQSAEPRERVSSASAFFRWLWISERPPSG